MQMIKTIRLKTVVGVHTSNLKNNKYKIESKGNIIMTCEIGTG